ncbi:MAG TPA: hydrolase [Planctomycetota bacterium]|nr:hydrolase [Planctomycetota bacterium]
MEPAGADPSVASPAPLELLTPQNCALVLIDHQPQMFFGVQSHDRAVLQNNVVGLAEAAKVFRVPTVLTTVASKSFSGPLIPEIQAVFPDLKPIDRTSMNAWDDPAFRKGVEATGRKKIVAAALWTEVCLTMPTIDMLREGYQVYAVTDASGGTTPEAHAMAIQRMTQAGAIPVTWQQVMLEWQRDWARQETYEPVLAVVKRHSGAYGLGVLYANEMFGAHEGSAKASESSGRR